MTDTPTTLNLDQVYADAENRRKAIAKENATDEKVITEAKGRITARKQEDASLERLLKSRAPRTRTVRQQPASASTQAEVLLPPNTNDEPV